MVPKPRIALLIDAENVSSDHAEQIFRAVSALGELLVRRSYGDWSKTHLGGWQAVGRVRGIREMQHSPCASKKNASDIALAVDAVDLMHTTPVDAFAIVSGDSDFTPLATLLRERGRPVHGLGNAQTSAAFRAACSSFVELSTPTSKPVAAAAGMSKTTQAAAPAERALVNDVKKAPAKHGSAKEAPPKNGLAKKAPAKKAPAKKAKGPTPPRPITSEVEARLRNAIENAAGTDGWASLSVFGKHAGQNLQPKLFGHANWTKLFSARKGFEIRNAKSASVAVRSTV